MSAEWEMKKQLIEIINNADLPQEKAKYYTWFKLQFDKRELKTKLGDYNFKTHVIRLFNCHSSNNVNTALTLLHEASHHIDWVIRGKVNHDKHFYYVFRQLLYSAFDLNKITKEEVLAMSKISSDDKKLRKMAYEYRPKDRLEKSSKKDMVDFEVFNCYLVKETLKENGFRWNGTLKAWYITVEPYQIDDVKLFLKQLGCDDFEIQDANRMNIKRDFKY